MARIVESQSEASFLSFVTKGNAKQHRLTSGDRLIPATLSSLVPHRSCGPFAPQNKRTSHGSRCRSPMGWKGGSGSTEFLSCWEIAQGQPPCFVISHWSTAKSTVCEVTPKTEKWTFTRSSRARFCCQPPRKTASLERTTFSSSRASRRKAPTSPLLSQRSPRTCLP